MADRKEKQYTLGTPQENIQMCVKHPDLPTDLTCNDCKEFICSQCFEESHTGHKWKTINAEAMIKTKQLLDSLRNIEDKGIQLMKENIQRASQQMEENKERYDTDVSNLQNHYDSTVEKLLKIKIKYEKALRDTFKQNKNDLSKVIFGLEEKMENAMQLVKSLKEYNSARMTDVVLLETYRDLTELMSSETDNLEMSLYSIIYKSADINRDKEVVLESMMGEVFDADQIIVTQTNSFQWDDKPIEVLEAKNENECLIKDTEDDYIALINISDEKKLQLDVKTYDDFSLTDNDEIYATEKSNNSISLLSLSGSVSANFSVDPLKPLGICMTMDGYLLVSLIDTETSLFEPNSHSQRLVRLMTQTGDVVLDYEYQEDRQTRLFKAPWKVTQNSNTDICIINDTSEKTSEVVIIFITGSLRSVYHGHNLKEEFYPTDVVCDSHANIIVNDVYNNAVHLLNSDGKMMKYLLTEENIYNPTAMSLKKSNLWIGNSQGLVKVFHYKQ